MTKASRAGEAMFFDDFPVGYSYETASREMPRDEVVGFAEEWDPQDFHIDDEAGRASPYGGLIASGFHTLVTAYRLTLETGLWTEASMGSPGMEHVRWMLPVRPGDTLRVKATVTASRASASRPDRGRTTILYEVLNQKDEIVMSYSAIHILRRRA
ncbi:MAG: MaoC family dehydratase [Roseovarius sp.]|uniref:MaoC family dehydratase n=2 Tax=Roseovarius sp. TaxID=1486281 RepID=UPI0032EAAE60